MQTSSLSPGMTPAENESEFAEAIVTCEGNLHDPDFLTKFQLIVDKLKSLLYKSKKEEVFTVRKIEPWNSVRVTISIPKDAAQRLRALAQQGNQVLRQLGILSVQVEGDQVISLTLTGKNNEPQELLFTQSSSSTGATSSGNTNSLSIPSATSFLSSLVQNSQHNTANRQNQVSSSSHPSQLHFHHQPSSVSATPLQSQGTGAFRSNGEPVVSPNVVAPTGEAIPSLPKTGAVTSPRPLPGGPFPFASMTHAVHTLQRTDSFTPATQSGVKSPIPSSSPSYSTSQPVVTTSNTNLIRSTNRAPPLLQGVSQTVLLTRSDQTRFIYSGGKAGVNATSNPNLVNNMQQPASSSSSTSTSQSLQIQFVEATSIPSSASPYSQQPHQQLQFRPPQGQFQQFSNSSTVVTNVLLPNDRPVSSPLLVNLLQHGEGSSSPTNPTTPRPPTATAPSDQSSAAEEARTSMPPPPLSLTLSIENPKVKRYQLLQQQRKLKRGLSLDTQGSPMSPAGDMSPAPYQSPTSHSEPSSPMANDVTFNQSQSAESRSSPNVSPILSTDQIQQGQGQVRQMTVYQNQGGNYRMVNHSQMTSLQSQPQQSTRPQQQQQQQPQYQFQGQGVRFSQTQLPIHVKQEMVNQQRQGFHNQAPQNFPQVNGPSRGPQQQQQQRYHFFQSQDSTRMSQGYAVQVQRPQTPTQMQIPLNSQQQQGTYQRQVMYQASVPSQQQQQNILLQSQQHQNMRPQNQPQQAQPVQIQTSEQIQQGQGQPTLPTQMQQTAGVSQASQQNHQFLRQNFQHSQAQNFHLLVQNHQSQQHLSQAQQNSQFQSQHNQQLSTQSQQNSSLLQNRQAAIQNQQQRAHMLMQNAQLPSQSQPNSQMLIQNQQVMGRLSQGGVHSGQNKQNIMFQQLQQQTQQQMVLQQNMQQQHQPHYPPSSSPSLTSLDNHSSTQGQAQNQLRNFVSPTPTPVSLTNSVPVAVSSPVSTTSSITTQPASTSVTFVTPSAPPPRLLSTMYRAILSSQNQSQDLTGPASQSGGMIRKAGKHFPSGGKPRLLLNPLTGHLEPMAVEGSSSESDEDHEEGRKGAVKAPRGKHASRTKGMEQPASSFSGGKPLAALSAGKLGAFETARGRSLSTLSPSHVLTSPPSEPSLSGTGEKIKLRLKLEKNEPAYKVDVSYVRKPEKCASNFGQSGSLSDAEPSGNATTPEPRVPPLHISLRGKNAAVVVSPRRDEPAGSTTPYNPNIPPPPLTPKLGPGFSGTNTSTLDSGVYPPVTQQNAIPSEIASATYKPTKGKKSWKAPRPKPAKDSGTNTAVSSASSYMPGKIRLKSKSTSSTSADSSPPYPDFTFSSPCKFEDVKPSVPAVKPKTKSTRRKSEYPTPKGGFGLVPMSRSDISAHVRECLPEFTSKKVTNPEVQSAVSESASMTTQTLSATDNRIEEQEGKEKESHCKPQSVVNHPLLSESSLSNSSTFTKSDVFRENTTGTTPLAPDKKISGIDHAQIIPKESSFPPKTGVSTEAKIVKPPVRQIPDLLALKPKNYIRSSPPFTPISVSEKFRASITEQAEILRSEISSLGIPENSYSEVKEIPPLLAVPTVESERASTSIEQNQLESEISAEKLTTKKESVLEPETGEASTGSCVENVSILSLPIIPSCKDEDQTGSRNGAAAGEDSGIDSMDALSEKSPNQGESPGRKESESNFISACDSEETPAVSETDQVKPKSETMTVEPPQEVFPSKTLRNKVEDIPMTNTVDVVPVSRIKPGEKNEPELSAQPDLEQSTQPDLLMESTPLKLLVEHQHASVTELGTKGITDEVVEVGEKSAQPIESDKARLAGHVKEGGNEFRSRDSRDIVVSCEVSTERDETSKREIEKIETAPQSRECDLVETPVCSSTLSNILKFSQGAEETQGESLVAEKEPIENSQFSDEALQRPVKADVEVKQITRDNNTDSVANEALTQLEALPSTCYFNPVNDISCSLDTLVSATRKEQHLSRDLSIPPQRATQEEVVNVAIGIKTPQQDLPDLEKPLANTQVEEGVVTEALQTVIENPKQFTEETASVLPTVCEAVLPLQRLEVEGSIEILCSGTDPTALKKRELTSFASREAPIEDQKIEVGDTLSESLNTQAAILAEIKETEIQMEIQPVAEFSEKIMKEDFPIETSEKHTPESTEKRKEPDRISETSGIELEQESKIKNTLKQFSEEMEERLEQLTEFSETTALILGKDKTERIKEQAHKLEAVASQPEIGPILSKSEEYEELHSCRIPAMPHLIPVKDRPTASITVDLPDVEILHTTVVSPASVITHIVATPTSSVHIPKSPIADVAFTPPIPIIPLNDSAMTSRSQVNTSSTTVVSNPVATWLDSNVGPLTNVSKETSAIKPIGSVHPIQKTKPKTNLTKVEDKGDIAVTAELEVISKSDQVLYSKSQEIEIIPEPHHYQGKRHPITAQPLISDENEEVAKDLKPTEVKSTLNLIEAKKSEDLVTTITPEKEELMINAMPELCTRTQAQPQPTSPIPQVRILESPMVVQPQSDRVVPVSIIPRIDGIQPQKQPQRLFLSPLPNLVRPTQPGQPTQSIIRPIPVQPLELKPVLKGSPPGVDEVGAVTSSTTTSSLGRGKLEAIISALGVKTSQSDLIQHAAPSQLHGNILNVNRIPGVGNVIQVSSASLSSPTKHQNILSIPGGVVGGNGPRMITIPANLSHHLQAQHHPQSGITVLPSGHKVVPIKLLSLPKGTTPPQTVGGANQNLQPSRSSPTIIDFSNRSGSPQFITTQRVASPRPTQSAPLNLSNVGGNITLVPISTNHANLQKVLVSSPVKGGNVIQMMMNANKNPVAGVQGASGNSQGQFQPSTIRVVRPGGGFVDLKREPATGALTMSQQSLEQLRSDGAIKPVLHGATTTPPQRTSASISTSDQPITAVSDPINLPKIALPSQPLPTTSVVEAPVVADNTASTVVEVGENEEELEDEDGFGYAGGIIHDEQDVAVALASSQSQNSQPTHVVENGMDAHVKNVGLEASCLVSPRLSPDTIRNSSFTSLADSPSQLSSTDIHGEDQEIIDTFSGQSYNGNDDEEIEQHEHESDHTYVEKQKTGRTKRKQVKSSNQNSMGELTIEIPPVDLVQSDFVREKSRDVEDKKSAVTTRSTRSNTRIVSVSPDITALTSTKNETPKLPPPTPSVNKLNCTRELRNSPKPSPTGLSKTHSPISSISPGQSSGGGSSSPLPVSQAKTIGRNKRQRRESDSSSASKDENGEDGQKTELIDLNARPGKRRCSENAAELIKACIGAEDTPKRNTMLIKRLEDAKAKEAKSKKLTTFEEVDNDLDYVEFGRGGTSSRGSSEDRSSSRGSSVNRNLPSSRSQLKDDEKEIKGNTRANHRSSTSVKKRGKGTSVTESNNIISEASEKKESRVKAGRKPKQNIKQNLLVTNSGKGRPSATLKKEQVPVISKTSAQNTHISTENPRRKTRSSAGSSGHTDSEGPVGKRRRISKD